MQCLFATLCCILLPTIAGNPPISPGESAILNKKNVDAGWLNPLSSKTTTIGALPVEIQNILRNIEDLNDIDSKRPAFLSILKQDPGDIDALQDLGIFLKHMAFRSESPTATYAEQAESVFRFLIKLDSGSAAALYELHDLYRKFPGKDVHSEAARLLNQANQVNPNYATWRSVDESTYLENLANEMVG